VLEVVICAGALPASPGEFSFKAFMNGKMDLAQAEAIQAKIGAKNELALVAAQDQLEGRLSEKVRHFQNKLTDIVAIFEAWVDFPEEGLEFRPFDEVMATLQMICDEISTLINSFHQGKIVSDGIAVTLVGSPNVGKSSLMNALLGKERAIVSHIPGTTRDLVEDDLRLNNLHIRLIDTAGIRATCDGIEEEGIRRSKKAIERSDIVLYVLDATMPQTIDVDLPRDKTIAIWNKIDMEHDRPLPELPFKEVVSVSALQLLGLDDLCFAIDRIIWQEGAMRRDEVVITSLRHKEALQEAYGATLGALNGLKNGISAEFVSFDARLALQALGTVIGTDITEDVITRVFSKFCIGK
jgi:tRNA modification GTPase